MPLLRASITIQEMERDQLARSLSCARGVGSQEVAGVSDRPVREERPSWAGDPIAIAARTPHTKEPKGLCLRESNFKVIVHVFSPHVGAMVVHEFVRTGRNSIAHEVRTQRVSKRRI